MPFLGVDVPLAEVDRLFASFDPDGSGSIEYAELKKLLRSRAPSAAGGPRRRPSGARRPSQAGGGRPCSAASASSTPRSGVSTPRSASSRGGGGGELQQSARSCFPSGNSPRNGASLDEVHALFWMPEKANAWRRRPATALATPRLAALTSPRLVPTSPRLTAWQDCSPRKRPPLRADGRPW